jgi:hypothetical protein
MSTPLTEQTILFAVTTEGMVLVSADSSATACLFAGRQVRPAPRRVRAQAPPRH